MQKRYSFTTDKRISFLFQIFIQSFLTYIGDRD